MASQPLCHLMFSSRPSRPDQFPGRSSTSSWGFFVDWAWSNYALYCGVRACLPVEIRNAKSFPVSKSKRKILIAWYWFSSTSITVGHPGGAWRIFSMWYLDLNPVYHPEPTLENTENDSSYHMWSLFQVILCLNYATWVIWNWDSHLGMDLLLHAL